MQTFKTCFQTKNQNDGNIKKMKSSKHAEFKTMQTFNHATSQTHANFKTLQTSKNAENGDMQTFKTIQPYEQTAKIKSCKVQNNATIQTNTKNNSK